MTREIMEIESGQQFKMASQHGGEGMCKTGAGCKPFLQGLEKIMEHLLCETGDYFLHTRTLTSIAVTRTFFVLRDNWGNLLKHKSLDVTTNFLSGAALENLHF